MATYTSNLNLKKPALDDDALITDINNNMDILDAAANGIQDALAIVATGNTHAAITSGQFVYVRSHSTLTEGLYVASSNIAANATLSSSNLTADSKGGLNALSEHIENCLKSFSIGQVTSNNPITLSVSSDAISGILVGSSYTSGRHVLAFVTLRNGNTAYSTTISSQNITVSVNGNSIVITSDNTYGSPLYLIPFNQNHIDNLVIT